MPNANGVVDSGTDTRIGLQPEGDNGDPPSGLGNVISGNRNAGVDLIGAVGAVVEGDVIGVNAAGTASLTNGGVGVLVSGGSGGLIGGPVGPSGGVNGTGAGPGAGAGNIIGGSIGIELTDAGAPAGTNGYQIEDNFIGTNPTGTHNFIGNVGVFLEGGVATQGVANTTIAGNVIDNQLQAGVDIFGPGARTTRSRATSSAPTPPARWRTATPSASRSPTGPTTTSLALAAREVARATSLPTIRAPASSSAVPSRIRPPSATRSAATRFSPTASASPWVAGA